MAPRFLLVAVLYVVVSGFGQLLDCDFSFSPSKECSTTGEKKRVEDESMQSFLAKFMWQREETGSDGSQNL